ncbi:MAG: hypothetical protein COA78_21190 [Blastopirellula sp.]|nr:MAG: hypothetical protein COA78_21190 [Blastopirellula sp.]
MDKFFCYCPDAGFDTFETEKEAKESAETSIDWYRDNADEGWDDAVNQVCWGEIKQHASICNVRPSTEDDCVSADCDTICDYQLKS